MIDEHIEQKGIESHISGRQRVSALVALTFLEVIKASDRPLEVFEEEDTSITMPRRLGLSDVVERRIRNYQQDTKKGTKISDDEFKDLVLPLNAGIPNGLGGGNVSAGDLLAFELESIASDGGEYQLLGVEFYDSNSTAAVNGATIS